MKNSTILKMTAALAIIFLGYTNSWGQTLTVNGQSLSQHGSNSAGTVVATENVDTVATGGITRYYVVPDATANPAYTLVGGVLGGTLSSNFNWATANPVGAGSPAGTIAQVGAIAYANYRQVTWAGTGTIDVTVQEQAGTCASGTTKTIPVRIIAVPTANGGADPAAQCSSTPVVTFAVPISLTSDLAVAGVANRVRVNYTITAPDASTFVGPLDIDLDKSATSFNVTLTGATLYGNYTLTINSVSDRISRKSNNVPGTIGAKPTVVLTVNRIPVTGPIYHLPNN